MGPYKKYTEGVLVPYKKTLRVFWSGVIFWTKGVYGKGVLGGNHAPGPHSFDLL